MNKTNTIGVDLAKNVFHLRIQDASGSFYQTSQTWTPPI